MAMYFIETSLPGDDGKYFRYIVLDEKTRNKYIKWFESYDWDDDNRMSYDSGFEYIYKKSEILDALLIEAKPITNEQIKFLKEFCPGTRFDIFQRLINQHCSDDDMDPDDDDPVNDEENHKALKGIR